MSNLSPEQERRYAALFEDDPPPGLWDAHGNPQPIPVFTAPSPLTIDELRALRKVRRERRLLLKDGFTEAEAEELLADSNLGLTRRRRSVLPRWPQLFELPGRYVGGLDEQGVVWMYDRHQLDEHNEPTRLMPVDPLTAQQAGPLMTARAAELGRALEPIEQVTIVATVQQELLAKYGTRFLERGRR